MKIYALILFSLLLSACGIFNKFFPDKSNQYQEAKLYKAIELPKGISSDSIRDTMPVPEVVEALKNVPLPKDVDRPASLKVELMTLGVQKRSAGDRHWIFVDKPASKVWPEVSEFVKSKNISISLMFPSKGLIEADWYSLDEKGNDGKGNKKKTESESSKNNGENYLEALLDREIESAPEKKSKSKKKLDKIGKSETQIDKTKEDFDAYRFRLQIQPGLQRNTSRVILLIDTFTGSNPELHRGWPETSEQVTLEQVMLNDLAEYLAQQLEAKSSVSLLAQQMTRKFDIKLIENEGERKENYLLLNQDFNQSWFLAGKAIRKAKLPLYDLNRSEGTYFLKTDQDDKNAHAFRQQLSTLKSSYNIKKNALIQITLVEGTEGVRIAVSYDADESSDPKLARYILSQIQKNI